ncbi:MAG TPA: SPOR domain-containing protein, partial [Burkholderiales bacterium]
MPRSVSDEEIELRKRARRRLVGAIVLVTVAVMILPMVLDQEPTTVTQDIAITIPPKGDAGSFAPRAVTPPARPPSAPKPAETPAESKAPAETGKSTAEPPKAEKPAAEPAPPARTAEAVPAAKPEPKPDARPEAKAETKTVAKPDAAASAEAFVVQLDAFSNPENARQQQ